MLKLSHKMYFPIFRTIYSAWIDSLESVHDVEEQHPMLRLKSYGDWIKDKCEVLSTEMDHDCDHKKIVRDVRIAVFN